jgi:hypothetical protein
MGRADVDFDEFWTVGPRGEWLASAPVLPPTGTISRNRVEGDTIVAGCSQPSVAVLHKRWTKLEDEHHRLAIAIDRARRTGAELGPMRKRQAELLLEISAVVAEIQGAPARTMEDFAALLDVALEHELDLAGDIAFYGPHDYPMTARLLRALSRTMPGFEFNSLRRWLSSPGQFEQLMGTPNPTDGP